MPAAEHDLDVLLIADDDYRVAMLRERMCKCGVSCTLRRLAQTGQASAYVRRQAPYKRSPRPDLILYDLAEPSDQALKLVRDIAFGEHRSEVPVVLLTSPESEPLLESGAIDEGEATMFSPKSLGSVLSKLVNGRRDDFLDALRTIYQYGPILVRQPTEFLDRRDALLQLSA